jgi:hypothetical protein
MTKRIDSDLFARLMQLSARERSDILEFLGQSAVSGNDLLATGVLRDKDTPRPRPERDRGPTRRNPVA